MMHINQLVYLISKMDKNLLVKLNKNYFPILLFFFNFFKDNYEWKYETYTELPKDDELIIYEIHVSDFCGNFTDISNKIDYFKKLGINASMRFFLSILFI